MKLLLTDAQRIQITKQLTSILMNLQSCTSCGSRNVTTYSNDDLDEMACEAHLRDEFQSSNEQPVTA
jgi:hypothetical protein